MPDLPHWFPTDAAKRLPSPPQDNELYAALEPEIHAIFFDSSGFQEAAYTPQRLATGRSREDSYLSDRLPEDILTLATTSNDILGPVELDFIDF
jgi:hypothetical protein